MAMANFAPLAFSPVLASRLVRSGLDLIVTGGGGWLGQATLEMLDSCLGEALRSRVHVFGSHTRELRLRSGRSILCRVLTELGAVSPRPCLVLHYAFLTRDRVADMPL